MKQTVFAFLILLAVGTAGANAQNKKAENKQEQAQQQANNMAKQLKLDDETTAWFVPLYAEYQDTLRSLRRASMPNVKNNSKAEELSDLDAAQQLENIFKNEEQTVALRRAYSARFKERLTPQQLLRLFRFQTQPRLGNRPGERGGAGRGNNFRPMQGGMGGNGFPMGGSDME